MAAIEVSNPEAEQIHVIPHQNPTPIDNHISIVGCSIVRREPVLDLQLHSRFTVTWRYALDKLIWR